MHTRRHFIKTTILGATAASFPGCRKSEPPSAAPSPSPTATRQTRLRGDDFETCHAVRDGLAIPTAEVRASHDAVIIGGGPSGLSSAYLLRERDLLLLEKEDEFGGNCILDEWEGVRMSTGGAFYTESEDELVALFKEVGADGRKVIGGDSLVIDGKPTREFFTKGADELPLPQQARDDFKRSREGCLELLKTRSRAELDATTFSEILKPYDPIVTKFWDSFGPSNWGGIASETSGLIGCGAYLWAGGADDPRWTFAGGMAGGAHALAEWLKPRLGERMQSGCAVYRIEREKKGAIVRYMKGGQPFSVRARVVIMAVPKFYAAYVIPDLPKDQLDAMKAYHYAPYPVFNVCLNQPGPEPAYDNWFLDTPFTDMVPADWILYAGKGPKQRKTALTVYHPLREDRRKELLVDPMVLEMADAVAENLERHFPGTLAKIAEIRVYRRGHPMYISRPGRMKLVTRASRAHGSVLFANTDSLAGVSSFDGGYRAARRASEEARKLLRA